MKKKIIQEIAKAKLGFPLETRNSDDLSCRVEKFVERVPKKETRETDTGEFIEIERTRISCGNEHAGKELVK